MLQHIIHIFIYSYGYLLSLSLFNHQRFNSTGYIKKIPMKLRIVFFSDILYS